MRVVLLSRPARHAFPAKGPAELVDREIDWTVRLAAGDELAHSDFVLPPGLVAEGASNTPQVTTLRISGGELGRAYEILNRVTTVKGVRLEETVKQRVK